MLPARRPGSEDEVGGEGSLVLPTRARHAPAWVEPPGCLRHVVGEDQPRTSRGLTRSQRALAAWASCFSVGGKTLTDIKVTILTIFK